MTQPNNAGNREATLEAEVASLLTNWKAETVDSGLPTYTRLVIREVREQVAREIDAEYRKRNRRGLSGYDEGALYGLDIAEQIARGCYS